MIELEWHVVHTKDGCYQSNVEQAKEDGVYIHISLSKEEIGDLLQGKHIELLFLNDDYRQKGMLDIELTDNNTNCEVSEKIHKMIVGD